MSAREHDMVGWLFRGWDEAVRELEEVACVFERAVGRTYHRLEGQARPAEHLRVCRCHVCREVP